MPRVAFFPPRQDPSSALLRDMLDDAANVFGSASRRLFDRIGITVPSTDVKNHLESYAKITFI